MKRIDVWERRVEETSCDVASPRPLGPRGVVVVVGDVVLGPCRWPDSCPEDLPLCVLQPIPPLRHPHLSTFATTRDGQSHLVDSVPIWERDFSNW